MIINDRPVAWRIGHSETPSNSGIFRWFRLSIYHIYIYISYIRILAPSIIMLYHTRLSISGWWFWTFFVFPYIRNNHPNWLSHFGSQRFWFSYEHIRFRISPLGGLSGQAPRTNTSSAANAWISFARWRSPVLRCCFFYVVIRWWWYLTIKTLTRFDLGNATDMRNDGKVEIDDPFCVCVLWCLFGRRWATAKKVHVRDMYSNGI